MEPTCKSKTEKLNPWRRRSGSRAYLQTIKRREQERVNRAVIAIQIKKTYHDSNQTKKPKREREEAILQK
jgi:hypothetical protein